MLSLLALMLWIIAIPAFLGGLVWLGLATGAVAYVVTRAAFDRTGDMETLFGLGLQSLLLIGLIRLIGAVFP